MKVLIVALMTLASAGSLWAQGQIVEGSEVLTAAFRQNFGDISALALPPTSLVPLSDWLPPRAFSPFENLSLIEASRVRNENVSTFSPLPPTPSSDSSDVEMVEAFRPTTGGGLQFPIMPPTPDLQIQFNQAGIQPAPEPSTFMLLAIGLLTGAAIFRRSRTRARL